MPLILIADLTESANLQIFKY